MLHKLSKYLVGIGTFLFVAMFPVGELYAQYNLETITNKELFAYPPKSSLRATRCCTALPPARYISTAG